MTDNFEKFIRDNRNGFDALEPGQDLWAKIEKNINKKKGFLLKKFTYRAAAVALIFVLSYLFSTYMVSNNYKISGLFNKKQEVNIPELQEAENYYAGLIDNKLKEIKPFLTSYPTLEDEVLIELSDLDSIYRNMKNDLKDNIANREVVEAMIQNYRLRVSILEDILTQFKKEEETENNHTKQQKKNDPNKNHVQI